MSNGISSQSKKEEIKSSIEDSSKPNNKPEASQEANIEDQKVEAAKEKLVKSKPRHTNSKKELGLEEPLVFGKYSVKDVTVDDQSLANYIVLGSRYTLSSFGRRRDKAHYVAHINIIERLVNKLMRGGTGQKIGGKVIRTEGRLQGKKIKLMRIVEKSFDIIASKTNSNPVQLLVNALENSAPIEDTTRIRYGGINYNVAVGISASRRLDVALRNVALAALIGAFKNRKTLADALAEEIILAANKDPNSYAIKKKVEIEHIARSAR